MLINIYGIFISTVKHTLSFIWASCTRLSYTCTLMKLKFFFCLEHFENELNSLFQFELTEFQEIS